MACHKALTRTMGMAVFFCDPRTPWQKGRCENMNGLLRQFLPKSENLRSYSQQELDAIANLLNNRPQQVLNWRSPNQALVIFCTPICNDYPMTNQ